MVSVSVVINPAAVTAAAAAATVVSSAIDKTGFVMMYTRLFIKKTSILF